MYLLLLVSPLMTSYTLKLTFAFFLEDQKSQGKNLRILRTKRAFNEVN